MPTPVPSQEEMEERIKSILSSYRFDWYMTDVGTVYKDDLVVSDILGLITLETREIRKENALLRKEHGKMRDWIKRNCCEKPCEKDRDPDCFSCQTWNFIDSIPSRS